MPIMGVGVVTCCISTQLGTIASIFDQLVNSAF